LVLNICDDFHLGSQLKMNPFIYLNHR